MTILPFALPQLEPTTLATLSVAAVVAGLCCLLLLVVLVLRLPRAPDAAMLRTIAGLEAAVDHLPSVIREEARAGRDELRATLSAHQQGLDGRLAGQGRAQVEQLGALRREAAEGRATTDAMAARNAESFAAAQSTRLGETNAAVLQLAARLMAAQADAREVQRQALEDLGTRVATLMEANARQQEAIRETIHGNLQQLRTDNEAKLEQMRQTVDEKLRGTLDARLGESFKAVSERLEHVHRGLGEMQALATGVGDLKRVLTNVKSRGGWGEVQLGTLLEDLLTPDQFGRNVRVRPESGETVEFAIRLPGRGLDDRPLHLPIDAKFPHEDYDRLITAQDTGSIEEVERAALALERAVRLQARTIAEKYVHPPHSTDFAILYLPTEGLFAEVIRRPGLGRDIQNTHRVVITGPTTLAALVSSLQMGFRTLAIERRSSEVWQVLGAAKAEFRKYGEVWERLGKQLDTAKKTVDEAGRRTRAVERQLREVETLPGAGAAPIEAAHQPSLELPDLVEEEDGAPA